MPQYTLFVSTQARDPVDGGGSLRPLRATTIEEARVEARTHVRDDEDVCTDDIEILEISFREKVGP